MDFWSHLQGVAECSPPGQECNVFSLTWRLIPIDFFSFFKFLKIYLFNLCVWVHCHSSDTPEGGIRSHYRWLWVTMWLLGMELRTSGREDSARNRWAISPVLKTLLMSPCLSIRSLLDHSDCLKHLNSSIKHGLCMWITWWTDLKGFMLKLQNLTSVIPELSLPSRN